jgi:hypothetical protein
MKASDLERGLDAGTADCGTSLRLWGLPALLSPRSHRPRAVLCSFPDRFVPERRRGRRPGACTLRPFCGNTGTTKSVVTVTYGCATSALVSARILIGVFSHIDHIWKCVAPLLCRLLICRGTAEA